MKNKLSDLKVVEIASVLAGPAVGMFFAENGAQVVKIENKKTGGDVTRSWKLKQEKDSSSSAYFASVNWHKEYVFLDFTNEKELKEAKKYLTDADIVITNFKSGDAEKFGLSHQDLKELNPSIIIGEIHGFGENDERVAYDLVLQAESGFMSMNGQPDSDPVKMPVALIDLLAAHQLKEGILVALFNKEPDQGAIVSVSLYDAAIASLANQATNWLMVGHVPQQMGSLHPNIAPYGELFKSKDEKYITFAIGSNKQFSNLCRILGLEDLSKQEKFSNNQQRVINREELYAILNKKVRLFHSNDLIPELRKLKVPVAVIKNLKEVFEDKAAKELILTEKVNGVETQRTKTAVYKITDL